jgi:SnoaL-like protein
MPQASTRLASARSFIEAVQAKNDDAAAALCADDVEVLLPGANATLRGKDGVRQMINMAPKLEQRERGEEQRGDEVRISTLTRAPGIFASYTTWLFTFEGDKIRRLSFELRAAN